MKAKIKETGEIITVGEYDSNGFGDLSYRDCSHEEGRCYKAYELDFEVDNQKSIDWEQRRYELIKDLTCSMLSNSEFFTRCRDRIHTHLDYQKIAINCAFHYADEMIKQLKEEKNDV